MTHIFIRQIALISDAFNEVDMFLSFSKLRDSVHSKHHNTINDWRMSGFSGNLDFNHTDGSSWTRIRRIKF